MMESRVCTVKHPMNFALPRLVVSLSDPSGIGPEVVLKALADKRLTEIAEITVLGSLGILEATYQRLKNEQNLADPADLNIIDSPTDNLAQLQLGEGNAVSGAASFAYLDQAITHTLAGEFEGIVTAPIASEVVPFKIIV